jgi:hypothetical protein
MIPEVGLPKTEENAHSQCHFGNPVADIMSSRHRDIEVINSDRRNRGAGPRVS